MDRLRSGFHHRKPRKDSPSRPTIITDTTISSGKTTPEPAVHHQGQHSPLQVPGVPTKKSSPFRALRDLSRSHKRARSPNPRSETNSPVSAISAFSARGDSLSDRHTTSPHPLSAVAPDTRSDHHGDDLVSTSSAPVQQPPPRMPSFLALSLAEIDARFQELVWMERNRLLQGNQNPAPSFRWAHVAGDHRKLDRYMNIQPWANNRVRLRVGGGQQDYVNASPISLTSTAPPAPTRLRQDTTAGDPAGGVGGGQDRYIAMQGPKHKTTGHVWRMVVEQLESPAVIVMLTETHEGNTEKCYPYFPRKPEDPPLEVNRKDEFHDGFRASVRCEAIEETEAGDAIELRRLIVRVYKGPKEEGATGAGARKNMQPAAGTPVDENGDVKMCSPVKDTPDGDGTDETDFGSDTVEVGRASSSDQDAPATATATATKTAAAASQRSLKDGSPEQQEYEERVVWHFLYKLWPDFGVPALEDLDSFFTLMRLSREKNAHPSNPPRIVHCSAGVGRSGTFIALEHLMREMDAGVLDHWDDKAARWPPRRKRRGGQQYLHADGNDAEACVEDLDEWLHNDGGDGADGEGEEEEEQPGRAALEMDVEEDREAASETMQDNDNDNEEDPGNGNGNGNADTNGNTAAAAVEPDDLIFHTVNQLREQRRSMVQAESQYLFLYQVLRKLWEDRHGTGIRNTQHEHQQQHQQQKHHYLDGGWGGAGSPISSRHVTPVSAHPPRLCTPDGEPAAKRFEFDPFVERRTRGE